MTTQPTTPAMENGPAGVLRKLMVLRQVEKLLRRPGLREVLQDRQGWSEGEFEDKVDQIVLEGPVGWTIA